MGLHQVTLWLHISGIALKLDKQNLAQRHIGGGTVRNSHACAGCPLCSMHQAHMLQTVEPESGQKTQHDQCSGLTEGGFGAGAGLTSRSLGQMTMTSLPKGAKRPRLRTRYFMSWSYQATMIFLGIALVQSGSEALGGALSAWLPAAVSNCLRIGRPSASGSKNPACKSRPYETIQPADLGFCNPPWHCQPLGVGRIQSYSCINRR